MASFPPSKIGATIRCDPRWRALVPVHALSATFICTASQSLHIRRADTEQHWHMLARAPRIPQCMRCACTHSPHSIRAKIYKMPFHSIPIRNDYYCSQSEWQRIKCCRQSLARLLLDGIDGRPTIATNQWKQCEVKIFRLLFLLHSVRSTSTFNIFHAIRLMCADTDADAWWRRGCGGGEADDFPSVSLTR